MPDDASGVKSAGTPIATFGVSDQAPLDIISGKAKPKGRLAFTLPRSTKSVLEQHPDAPGYAETGDGALFEYGYGLGFRHKRAPTVNMDLNRNDLTQSPESVSFKSILSG